MNVELSEIEQIRLKNIELHKEELRKLFPEGLMKLNTQKPKQSRVKRIITPKSYDDITPRKSIRLACKRSAEDVENYSHSKKNRISDDESEWESVSRGTGIRFGNWSKIQRKNAEKKGEIWDLLDERKTKIKRSSVPAEPGRIEDIAETTSEKFYDSTHGTTCHQCRQKTLDTKTVCKNRECYGVIGQFCGPCLRNRYGESVKEAILNEDWHCPPCRGICNCSFCMKKRGKRATGILIHMAKQRGYQDVKTFLGD